MPTAEELHKTALVVDPWYWAYTSRLKLQGGVFQLQGHEYQVDIMQSKYKKQCGRKAAQMGFTENLVIRTLHGMKYGRYPKGALYLFPTTNDVTDFSKARFQPLINDNPTIAESVIDTDAANIKRISDAFLYLRGARATKAIEGAKKSSSALKSIPVDLIVLDERDEMEDSMVTLAAERLSHSTVQEEFHLSTPTIPDYGIDRMYNESDQRIWLIKCTKCGKETCLELEFPNSLGQRSNGSVFRKCIHCGEEISPANGRWVARYPDKTKDLVGWWISQLNSVYVNPKTILDMYLNPPNGDLSEFYNSKLGMAYIASENRLTKNDVYRCCGTDSMAITHHGPCAMGVDVGSVLHVTVGCRLSDALYKIVYVTRCESFDELYDIVKRYNVRSTVIDSLPETRKAREFQESAEHQVFLCQYSETQINGFNWLDRDGIVKVNRTEVCDLSHDVVVRPGQLELPRVNTEMEQFVGEMCNVAKVLEDKGDTGVKVYRYRKLGADHYRHSANYFLVAASQIGIAKKTLTSRFKSAFRKRPTALTA